MQFGLKDKTIKKIKKVLTRYPEVERAILYGSRAKGDFKRGSDIDLTLCGDGLTYPLLLKIDTELDDLLLPCTIDLSICAQIENPDLLEHIRRVGMVFYEKV